MAGGLLTDADARVLAEGNGAPIEGLYACGTSAASAMGDTYPGGGVSLGQSSVFGYLAAQQMVSIAGVGSPKREEVLR
jgi:3-oxosteroid 1-dehydrogenase